MDEQDRKAFEKFWKEDSGWYTPGESPSAEKLLADDAFCAALTHRDTSQHADQTQQACPMCRATQDEIERVKAEVKAYDLRMDNDAATIDRLKTHYKKYGQRPYLRLVADRVLESLKAQMRREQDDG